ncbi:phage tail-collar fiber domain-containing protein [Serratia fonticola]|uniref:Phage tail protein n=1 Tax=Serratia fonticola TaxID=47917 RepID=A0AAW3WVD3_SERFO|nr:phage tail protein [Serratia fonticola]MBC3214873.1 phage tail protein [Serratia fonticola]NYA15442.1 phage tail protein [Serratia fonticola]NYA35549.1 phage tail protein [Serratia fonticola]
MANNMYYSILTTVGTEKLAQAIITEIPVKLTTIAVGDGNGQFYSPTPDQVQLKRETWRGDVNDLRSAEDAANHVLAEGVVPTNVGGWTIREVGLFDDAGDLIAIGNYPDTIKPMPASGSGKQLYIQIHLSVDNIAALELIIDDSIVIASRKYVDDSILKQFNKLSEPDGYKYIGQCPSIEALREISFEFDNQLVFVSNYYSWFDTKHGKFYYDADDTTSEDNGGSIIVAKNGARVKSLKEEFTPEDFGALGGDEDVDTDALQRLFNAKVKLAPATGTYLIKNFNRPSAGFESWMTYNYVLLIDGFKGHADFSKATFVMPEGVPRITAIVFVNSEGTFILPKIKGNMQGTVMPSGYIDDCAVRIGANCKNLKILSNGIDHYPGHGIVIRHYIQDGVDNLDEGIPYDIDITAKNMRHCWQSGIVPITGDTIRIADCDVQYSGSTQNANGRAATVGHNIHTESVAGPGGLNNRLRNVWVQNCNGFNARMHGGMYHTAIDNLNVLNNNFRYNVIDGARFEAAAHKVTSSGNHYSNNGGRGVTFNCGSLTAAGSPLLQHAASFDDVFESNGQDGFTDLSGSKSLIVSGNIGLNGGHGITLQEGGRQSLSNLVIYNNGKGATETKYAINGGASSYSNVHIYNSAPEVNIQRAFNFRARSRVANVIVDENSAGFDVMDGHPAYFPANDGLLRLSGPHGTIIGRRMLVSAKGAGGWLMPDSFDHIGISFTAAADMYFPSPSSYNLFAQFSLELLAGSVTATVKVTAGTVNGTTQAIVTAGHTYSLRYTTLSNLQVTQIS